MQARAKAAQKKLYPKRKENTDAALNNMSGASKLSTSKSKSSKSKSSNGASKSGGGGGGGASKSSKSIGGDATYVSLAPVPTRAMKSVFDMWVLCLAGHSFPQCSSCEARVGLKRGESSFVHLCFSLCTTPHWRCFCALLQGLFGGDGGNSPIRTPCTPGVWLAL